MWYILVIKDMEGTYSISNEIDECFKIKIKDYELLGLRNPEYLKTAIQYNQNIYFSQKKLALEEKATELGIFYINNSNLYIGGLERSVILLDSQISLMKKNLQELEESKERIKQEITDRRNIIKNFNKNFYGINEK